MTDDSDPIDWFPGLHSGPRVGIGVNRAEIEQLRAMVHDLPSFFNAGLAPAAAHAVRNLDIRAGALAELDNPDAPVVMLPDEHADLRRAYDEYRIYSKHSRNLGPITELFADMDRRLGAAQIRLAASGGMNLEEHFPDRVVVDADSDLGEQPWPPPGQPRRVFGDGGGRRRRGGRP